VYAENLVYSTLDYGYTERDLPALVGFDVLPYAAIDSMTPPGSPYAETFEGFLATEAVWRVFDQIRIESVSPDRAFVPATIITETTEFDPETYTVPQSSLAGDVRAEGVVVRSDTQDRRVKVVRDAFEELNREQFGRDPDDAETGAERLVAMYCTSARIRKTVRSLVIEGGREFGLHLVEDLYPRVVEDIWSEHWSEIMRLEFELTPADVYPLVAKRCVTELRKMETNAELNDADPTTVWRHLS
jgi:pyruvate/2-oxoacid:ferredoxin oxidoreductase alpha subunit